MTRFVPVAPFLPCSLAFLVAFASGLIQVEAGAAEPAPVSFNRDIRPIMSNTCFLCHGFDVSSREAGMRLDLREEALKPTKNGFFPIVPGKPEESEAYLRITDSVDPMPPEDSHKTLTAAQKETIRRWIAEGATYDRHWAYEPLKKPEPPRIASHPVDAFIQARLTERKFDLSPEADRAQLLRRVSLDLTGLPPTPEEVAAFLADRSPGAYERHVDRLLSSPRRHVQIVFAGKAHPADDVGKHHLQRIYRRALDSQFGGRIAFVEGYDLHIAHFLVQGCDVWLNNPRKPLEASGTSGMKAGINGTAHLSIGDGWWAEGFTGQNGWLIEGHADPNDQGAQDWADAQAIYELLEQQLVPAFYERDERGLPRRWLQVVKQSIRTVLPHFSARRMVKEYVRGMYLPAARSSVVAR